MTWTVSEALNYSTSVIDAKSDMGGRLKIVRSAESFCRRRGRLKIKDAEAGNAETASAGKGRHACGTGVDPERECACEF
jgi:hypothetical protein